jgi:hypothetical protein
MIHAIIHHRSTFTGATGQGTMPVPFLDAADADEFMRRLDRSCPGIIHTWKSVEEVVQSYDEAWEAHAADHIR